MRGKNVEKIRNTFKIINRMAGISTTLMTCIEAHA